MNIKQTNYKIPRLDKAQTKLRVIAPGSENVHFCRIKMQMLAFKLN